MKLEEMTKIAFLGGDMRTAIAAKRLAEENTALDIYTWRVPECSNIQGICRCDSLYKATDRAKAVVLPLPASTDGTTLNCNDEDGSTKIPINSIAEAVDSSCIIIGGRLPKTFCDYAATHSIRIFDYFNSEAFQIKNAYTTAEAALSIAMNNLKKNIKGARVAVTGYGRIAKQLVKLLRLLSVNVTLLARKDSDLAWAALEGCKTIKLGEEKKEILRIATGYDIIFNTVPYWLFDEAFLRMVDTKTLIIDLASAPGGVDISQAKRLRSNVLWANSLPGKYAPESAGELIYDCVNEIIEREVSE